MKPNFNKQRNQKGNESFITRLAYILPKSFRVGLEKDIVYAQIIVPSLQYFIGEIMLLSFIIMILAGVGAFFFTKNPFYAIGGAAAGFAIVLIGFKSALSLLADKTSAEIEKVLPDMLMLMAANLRAGMIPENSFIESIRPQFGKLNYLLRGAAIETQGGKDFKDAILEMGERTNSKFFRDSMQIIAESIRSGGQLHLVLIISLINVIITTSSAAILGGLLNEGNAKAGLKSLPIYVLIGVSIFLVVRFGVNNFFASSSFSSSFGASGAAI